VEVLALATPQAGISRVWVFPDNPALLPSSAGVPGLDTTTANALVSTCKGVAKPWLDWAAELAEDSPYLGTFTVMDVPDPLDAQGALDWLRRQAFEALAGAPAAPAPPPLQLSTMGTGTKQPHSAVHYHEPSDEPGKSCNGGVPQTKPCYMWEGGHCAMVADPVSPDGICERWIPVPDSGS
jgi:hypothetical protein